MSVLRFTPEQYEAHLARLKASASPVVVSVTAKPAMELSVSDAALLKGAKAKQKLYALGRVAKTVMNKTEQAFAELLKQWLHDGTILWWKFHIIKVRLADGAWYEPDFLVMRADRTLWIYETKGGFTTDKGQLKIRACAEVFPVVGIIKATKRTKKAGGGFDLKDFSA